ncbi:AraC family transcriptional regulator [Leptothoe sp. LEGE 181152]|nr:AraC family transcriptional regulator [Leptothoe sp. LEGE 181152]
MAISFENFREIRTIAQQKGEALYRKTDFEREHGLPKSLGDGSELFIYLRGGLTLHIFGGTIWQTVIRKHQHGSDFPLIAKFYLSGSSRIQTQGNTAIAADYTEIAGCHYLYHLPDITEIEDWPANELYRIVIISAQVDYFRPFFGIEMLLPPPLRRLFDGDKTQRFHQALGQIPSTMGQVLQQILRAPYQGIMQRMYLESKVLELLTLQFAHWAQEPSPVRSRRMPSDELNQLHAAKAILNRNVNHPLDLNDLAQQVGLNEYRLKQGFRQVFGTTPFGYLHDCRMQHAQHLLLNSTLSIAGVAQRIGYRSPEAFCNAFRRQFMVSPKAYQLGK